jgi:hypothetical protein
MEWLIEPAGVHHLFVCVGFGRWRLDIYGNNNAQGLPGALVDVTEPNPSSAQLWDIEDAGQIAGAQYFYISSAGRYLDINGANPKPGTQVVHHSKTGNLSQKFSIGILRQGP